MFHTNIFDKLSSFIISLEMFIYLKYQVIVLLIKNIILNYFYGMNVIYYTVDNCDNKVRNKWVELTDLQNMMNRREYRFPSSESFI